MVRQQADQERCDDSRNRAGCWNSGNGGWLLSIGIGGNSGYNVPADGEAAGWPGGASAHKMPVPR